MRTMLPIMAVTLLGSSAALWHTQQHAHVAQLNAIDEAADSLRAIQREVRVRASFPKTAVNGRGWPVTIDPDWFKNDAPRNPLLRDNRPWMEIADEEDADLTHPRVRFVLNNTTAAFWYNPANGIVRARVPVEIADEQTLNAYNLVNTSSLASLFGPAPGDDTVTIDIAKPSMTATTEIAGTDNKNSNRDRAQQRR